MKLKAFVSVGMSIGAAIFAVAVSALPASAPKTVANLRAAYLGETTAHAKYAVYARVADKEGYKEVAQLFRAASDAEKTHAGNHKQVLAKLGVANPKAGEYTATPGSTKQNLTDALKGESYERDSMYPVMIQQARAEDQKDAERSMVYALSAEKQHAALYGKALKDLNKKPAPEGFYVCPVCGATYSSRNVPAVAPVCGTPKARFKFVK